MKKIGDIPEKNSSEWKRNEKLINETPALRDVRDISEGFRPGGGRIATRAPSQAYKDNWERIFGGDRSNVNHRDESDDSNSNPA